MPSPGSIRNPLARGCHALIREGAALVEDAAEVLAALAPQLRGQLGALTAATGEVQTSASWPDPDYDRLLAALGFDPVAPDELTRCTGLSAAAVSSMLLVLELGGHVSSCPGGRYCRART